ncbi:MAG: hypothetical protein ACJ72S_07655 [Nitrososphaeraceae archaeon]
MTLESDRIIALQRQIEWIEAHSPHRYHHYHHSNGNSNNDDGRNVVKQLRQELELLEEDAKADKLRSLPFYTAELLAGNLYAPSVMIRFTTVHYYKTLDLLFYYIVNA